jgi:type IV fimbrial biogenesis protein FimT
MARNTVFCGEFHAAAGSTSLQDAGMAASTHPCRRGFSLLELLLTIALVALILGLGVPSFSKISARARQGVALDALFHAVHLARKESIMRRRVVSLCPSFDGLRCAPGSDWSGGFLVFENSDRDEPPQVDGGEPVLHRHSPPEGIEIRANRRGFTLRSTVLRATNGTIVVCDRAGRIPARAVVISYTGRPRVALETPRGTPYSCAQ